MVFDKNAYVTYSDSMSAEKSSDLTAPTIRIEKFVESFPTVVAAAAALGVSRQTFYDWRRAGRREIPDPWCFKARDLLERRA